MLSWEFPPEIVGGLGVVVYELSKNLLEKGIDVKVVLPINPKNNDEIFKGKIISLFEKGVSFGVYDSLKYMKETRALSRDLSMFEFVREYTKKCVERCKGMDFDIIHAHDWITFPAGLELKRITCKPLILHVHSTEFDRAGGERGNEYVHEIERVSFLNCDKIIAVSNLVKERIVKGYGIEENKIAVVHNAIDFNVKVPQKTQSKPHKVVMYVGRLSWMKGVDFFLKAAKIVLDNYKNVRFVIVGKGEMMEDLINESIKLGIADKVSFEGYVNREEVIKRYYPYADVLVVPSRSEPFGLIALEAAHCSLPVVISKQSGVSEVLSHALKVDYWNIEEMAEKIVSLLKYEALNKEIRKNTNKEVKEITWQRKAKEVIDIYKEVLQW